MNFTSALGSRFSRITSTGKYIPEIDGLRFIAIFSVICFHLSGYVTAKLNFHPVDIVSATVSKGFFGVQLFFTISGFILSKPFAEAHLLHAQPPILKDYFLRRLTRLEPPYIVNLLLCYALLVWVNGQSASALLSHFMASVFYQHNLLFGEASIINSVAWSLEVEVQFYVLAPLLASVFAIRSKPFRRAIIAVATVLFALGASRIQPESMRLQCSILNFMQFFTVGFLLADFYILDWPATRGKRWLWDLGVIAGALVAWMTLLGGPPYGAMAQVVLPFAVLAMYVGVFRGVVLGWVLTRPTVATIGGMCYTIYLYHFAIISAAGRVIVKVCHSTDSWMIVFAISLTVCVPLIVVASGVLFVCFERPFMKKGWPRDFLLFASGRCGAGRA